MNLTYNKKLALGTVALMGVSIIGPVTMARADSITCRDYYAAYVDEATSPTPTVIVAVRPNFHGHYPEYHAPNGGYHGPDLHQGNGHPANGNNGNHGNNNNNNNDNNNDDAAIAAGVVAGVALLATTTTAVQDAELNDAENVINDIDQAQLGDGPQLEQLMADVQSDLPSGKTVSIAQVADAVNTDNQDLSFCAAGNLDTESELASSIASSVAAPTP